MDRVIFQRLDCINANVGLEGRKRINQKFPYVVVLQMYRNITETVG
ncbi:hypothetical protein [Chryseobacterium indoltheticum]|nr:hypothetical protein [Chryseobacterium indoltheticum]